MKNFIFSALVFSFLLTINSCFAADDTCIASTYRGDYSVADGASDICTTILNRISNQQGNHPLMFIAKDSDPNCARDLSLPGLINFIISPDGDGGSESDSCAKLKIPTGVDFLANYSEYAEMVSSKINELNSNLEGIVDSFKLE